MHVDGSRGYFEEAELCERLLTAMRFSPGAGGLLGGEVIDLGGAALRTP
jgi:hypothetical protein